MPYTPQDFTSLLGLSGFSETALTTHFKLYEGYVAHTNKIAEQLKTLTPNSPEMNELRRRFGWEFNGMRLHELYFEVLTANSTPLDQASRLYQQIAASFGSYDAWIADFTATAMTRGIGWAILYYDEKADQLFNTFINEHDLGHLANCKIILNVDVFEHAFMIDYNTNRADYVTACLNVLNWPLISGRL
jgi:superoxide dismutase, Fe-Mn family